jgi:hydrogenase nickel incorporation protein HypA/HybF
MHELSIALSILDEVAEQAAQRRARVVAVHLKIGPLSGVVAEALRSAYDLARESSQTPEAQLVIEAAPLVVYCPTCACRRQLASMQQFVCPLCATPTPEVVGGRELELTALEVIDGSSATAPGAGAPADLKAE